MFVCMHMRVCVSLPVSILPSKAAGPSNMRLLICKNSSGSSPPTTVKPKPRLLFSSLVLINVPLSSAGFLVKNGFPPTFTYTLRKGLQYLTMPHQNQICEATMMHFRDILLVLMSESELAWDQCRITSLLHNKKHYGVSITKASNISAFRFVRCSAVV